MAESMFLCETAIRGIPAMVVSDRRLPQTCTHGSSIHGRLALLDIEKAEPEARTVSSARSSDGRLAQASIRRKRSPRRTANSPRWYAAKLSLAGLDVYPTDSNHPLNRAG
jgi:hypothetical protein